MQLTGYALTHQGRIRKNNEDNYYLFGSYKKDINVLEAGEDKSASVDMSLAAVFDGMGGEEAGEVASLIAAESVSPSDINSVKSNSEYQLKAANGKICDEILKRNARVGTTAVMLYFDGSEVVSVNIGDSRAYLFRGGQLKPLSKDHSEGQTMVDMGLYTEEQAKKNKSWHKLTQHLGIFPEEFEIEPYLSERIAINKDDIYLLCSDGLTDMLSNEQIGSIIDKNKDKSLRDISMQLRDAALSSGGKDNVTVVLVRVEEEKGKDTGKLKNIFLPMMAGVVIGAVLMLIVSSAVKKTKGSEEESSGKEIEKSVITDTPGEEEIDTDEKDSKDEQETVISDNEADDEESVKDNEAIIEDTVSENETEVPDETKEPEEIVPTEAVSENNAAVQAISGNRITFGKDSSEKADEKTSVSKNDADAD